MSLIIDSALQAYETVLKQTVPKRGLQPATSTTTERLKFKFSCPLRRPSESENLEVEGAQ